MSALITLGVIIFIITVYELIANDDEDNLLDIEMSNTEYEKRFILTIFKNGILQ